MSTCLHVYMSTCLHVYNCVYAPSRRTVITTSTTRTIIIIIIHPDTAMQLQQSVTLSTYAVVRRYFFFLSFSLLIGWQLSIWNCRKPFSSLLYNSIPVFLATFFKYCSRGFPVAFLLDIASSRLFSTNSLCLTVCPIH